MSVRVAYVVKLVRLNPALCLDPVHVLALDRVFDDTLAARLISCVHHESLMYGQSTFVERPGTFLPRVFASLVLPRLPLPVHNEVAFFSHAMVVEQDLPVSLSG